MDESHQSGMILCHFEAKGTHTASYHAMPPPPPPHTKQTSPPPGSAEAGASSIRYRPRLCPSPPPPQRGTVTEPP